MAEDHPRNLYDINNLQGLPGRARLLLHSIAARVFQWQESTVLIPHDKQQTGQLLAEKYARYTTDPGCNWDAWEGRYPGAMGREA